jgi:hypothetical protein
MHRCAYKYSHSHSYELLVPFRVNARRRLAVVPAETLLATVTCDGRSGEPRVPVDALLAVAVANTVRLNARGRTAIAPYSSSSSRRAASIKSGVLAWEGREGPGVGVGVGGTTGSARAGKPQNHGGQSCTEHTTIQDSTRSTHRVHAKLVEPQAHNGHRVRQVAKFLKPQDNPRIKQETQNTSPTGTQPPVAGLDAGGGDLLSSSSESTEACSLSESCKMRDGLGARRFL